MIELLVEDLVHLVGTGLELVHLQDGVRQADRMLEARACQLFILLHQRVNLVEVAVQEARHNTVFVLIDLVCVEALILLNQILQVLAEAKVGVDREAIGAKSLKVEQVV